MTITKEELLYDRVPKTTLLAPYCTEAGIAAAKDLWGAAGNYAGFPLFDGSVGENFEVLSDDANDVAGGSGARSIELFYVNSTFLFGTTGFPRLTPFSTTIATNGVTPVVGSVAGWRVWYARVATSGSGGVNAGNITIRWTTTTSVVFGIIPAGAGETKLSGFTVPAGCEAHIYGYGAVLNSASDRAEFDLRFSDVRSSRFGVARTSRKFTAFSGTPYNNKAEPALVIPGNTDIIMRCLATDSAATDVSTYMNAKIISSL